MTLPRYGEWAPTGFDAPGAFLADRGNWLVAPVSRTRDSEAIDESNFSVGLEILGGEGENVEVHRFGHWGPGWIEIILIRPDSAEATRAEEMAEALADYPVLNDEDFSTREWEDKQKDWENWARCDFIRMLAKDFGLSDTVKYRLEDMDSDELHRFCDEHSSQYVPICLQSFDCSREQLARFLWAHRHDGATV